MFLKYTDSEVQKYHPICEMALNEALKKLNLQDKYEIVHHEVINGLEMDFAIKNKKTKKYLGIIEVKRVPTDLNSTRYQNQAQTYVREVHGNIEKPYYVLTNLEFMYIFKYDEERKRPIQQILEPGLIKIGMFKDYKSEDFLKLLSIKFEEMILGFLNDSYSYFLTFDNFESYLRKIKDKRQILKNSLILLLYEYIRGALKASRNQKNVLKDIRKFDNDIQEICREASRINFKEIFSLRDEDKYIGKLPIENILQEELYNLGERTINGDMIANILHTLMCEGQEQLGKVPTDSELARILSYFIKGIINKIEEDEIICDPASGSGSLISAGIDIFNINANQVWANDYDKNLLELLSLRLGLKYSSVISRENTPKITCDNIIDLKPKDFTKVKVILLNPPYVAGIDCSSQKEKFSKKIQEITGEKSCFLGGQIGIEAPFLELILALIPKESIIGCIMPKQYLNSRGNDAVKFRKFLLNKFGLEKIFYYPSDDLFKKVVKDTCIFIGVPNSKKDKIKLVSSYTKISDIDPEIMIKNLKQKRLSEIEFEEIMSGVEGIAISKEQLFKNCDEGWNIFSSERLEASEFIKNNLLQNEKLIKISDLNKKFQRGSIGNSGGSELLFMDSATKNEELLNVYKLVKNSKEEAIKNADDYENISIKSSKYKFFDMDLNTNSLEKVLTEYNNVISSKEKSKQTKKQKSNEELKKILKSSKSKITPKYSVLIPRAIRSIGRIFFTEKDFYISTNFFIMEIADKTNSEMITSWMSTIIFQLLCEFIAKDQEGMRKMESFQIKDLLIPNISAIKIQDKKNILDNFDSIKFLNLSNPEIREVDKIWGEIIFGENCEESLEEIRRYLKFLVQQRTKKS